MPDFNWNIPLPLHFGQAETPQMSLARALPDEPLRPSSKPLSSNASVRPTVPTSVISCRSCSA